MAWGCCAPILSHALDCIASSRLSATLKKALALRAVKPHLCAGHMEDEVAVQVPLLPFIDVNEEIAKAVLITPLKPVEIRTASQSRALTIQCFGYGNLFSQSRR